MFDSKGKAIIPGIAQNSITIQVSPGRFVLSDILPAIMPPIMPPISKGNDARDACRGVNLAVMHKHKVTEGYRFFNYTLTHIIYILWQPIKQGIVYQFTEKQACRVLNNSLYQNRGKIKNNNYMW